MKELKLYTCEFCGTNYKNKEDAMKCEKCHKIPNKIVESRYHACKVSGDGYPDRIKVAFQDGTTKMYHL